MKLKKVKYFVVYRYWILITFNIKDLEQEVAKSEKSITTAFGEIDELLTRRKTQLFLEVMKISDKKSKELNQKYESLLKSSVQTQKVLYMLIL